MRTCPRNHQALIRAGRAACATCGKKFPERVLILPLKHKWFVEIREGRKPFEFRLRNAYWTKRLEGRHYDRVVFTDGYPAKSDTARRIEAPYRGFEKQTITSEEWGNVPMEVFAILTPNHSSCPS